ncbi:MAG: hypothetical protein ACRD1M_04055 [Terriglobales bacterium]
MHNSTRRVELRDNRYLDFAGYRRDGGASQTFFWVDLAQAQAIGAIYVCLEPVGGCDQQLLIFSRQMGPVANDSQLPSDFLSALAAWQAKARGGPPGCRQPNCKMPAVLTQYVIGSGERRILPHTAGACAAMGGAAAVRVARCRWTERVASELDLEAALLINPDAGAEPAQSIWRAQHNQRCGASDASPDCFSLANERHAAEQLATSSHPATVGTPAPTPAALARIAACRNRAPCIIPSRDIPTPPAARAQWARCRRTCHCAGRACRQRGDSRPHRQRPG